MRTQPPRKGPQTHSSMREAGFGAHGRARNGTAKLVSARRVLGFLPGLWALARAARFSPILASSAYELTVVW